MTRLKLIMENWKKYLEEKEQKVDLNLEQSYPDSSMELERKMEEVDGKTYAVVIVSGPKGKAEGRSNPIKSPRAIDRQIDRATRRAVKAYHKL